MGRLDTKFRKAATDLGQILPGTDDPFWNFYRNVATSPTPGIIIPVAFFKGTQKLAEANYRCLGSPLRLDLLAMDTAARDLQNRNPSLEWDGASANGGRIWDRADIESARATDPLLASSATHPASLFSAIERFSEEMRKIDPHTMPPDAIRDAYEWAKAAFASSVTRHSAQVEWQGTNGFGQKLRRILGLS